MESVNDYRELIETRLALYLPGEPAALTDAMAYSITAGGKRLRPLILLLTAQAYNKETTDTDTAVLFACALEMIHTYTLIHDDLPAIDNDDLRRGKPSCHAKYGEAVAILAGDALLNRAYELMAGSAAKSGDNRAARAMSAIADACGASRLIGGQTIDILSENKECDSKTLLYIHKNKTAALFEAAFAAGGILAGAEESELAKLRAAGEALGLWFQVADDINDATKTAGDMGKTAGKDAKNGKATYVSVFGIDAARQRKDELANTVRILISGLICDKTQLSDFIDGILRS